MRIRRSGLPLRRSERCTEVSGRFVCRNQMQYASLNMEQDLEAAVKVSIKFWSNYHTLHHITRVTVHMDYSRGSRGLMVRESDS